MASHVLATVYVPAASRHYRVVSTNFALVFYRDFDSNPGIWHREGDVPGADPADWREVLRRHVFGLPQRAEG